MQGKFTKINRESDEFTGKYYKYRPETCLLFCRIRRCHRVWLFARVRFDTVVAGSGL
jgi:hypothetical protein